jgi:UDP-N-acetylglucosamine 2-epimerase (non-hydrolysing)
MVAFEKEIEVHRPDLVLVVGDVNSTMACAIVAKKMCIKVAHVEAGIRSGDYTMPEEINRIVTDSITDYFFTTSLTASQNLLRAGFSEQHVHFVGNVMIDTLLQHKNRFLKPKFFDQFQLSNQEYLVLTLHRPSNVDERAALIHLLNGIDHLAAGRSVIFPVHPRTKNILEAQPYHFKNIVFVEPQGYLNFMFLVSNAFAVITDSGGLSEETTVLGIPCFTMRETTERPETELIGTNTLVGNDLDKLNSAFKTLVSKGIRECGVPDLWDGRASERIVDLLLQK